MPQSCFDLVVCHDVQISVLPCVITMSVFVYRHWVCSPLALVFCTAMSGIVLQRFLAKDVRRVHAPLGAGVSLCLTARLLDLLCPGQVWQSKLRLRTIRFPK